MCTALRVLSSVLMLDCGIPDARAASQEEEAATRRYALARLIAPGLAGDAPEPPLLRVDCSSQRRQDCIRFCVRQYPVPAASLRCIRACSQYCATCPADRRPYCRAN